jgi:hypothetical protein
MNGLVPKYKIRKGSLIDSKNNELLFSFGLVYDDDGIYLFELFLDSEERVLHDYVRKQDQVFQKGNLRLDSSTEDGHSLKAENLWFSNIRFSERKAMLTCYGHLLIELIDSEDFYGGKHAQMENYLPPIYYLKLEGLKMTHTDRSEKTLYRAGKEIPWYAMTGDIWDNSSIEWRIGDAIYLTNWRNDPDNEDLMMVEFESPTGHYRSLLYESFYKVKEEFISILSFINGAAVHIKEEYTGDSVSMPKLNSQKNTSIHTKRLDTSDIMITFQLMTVV